MCSIVLFSFYYMINFALRVKSQKTFSIHNMKTCHPPDYYYNTINDECSRCDRKVYNNICYSLDPISIYGFGRFNNSYPYVCTNNNDYFTELDEEGKYSGELYCRSSKISGSYPDPSYGSITSSFSFRYLDNIRSRQSQTLTHTFDLKDYDVDKINYAYDSCLN